MVDWGLMSEAVMGNSMASWGRIWFQYRSYSPLPVLLVILFVPPAVTVGSTLAAFFVSLMFVAEAGRIWAVGYAGSVTRTRGDTVPVLVHAGPFRYVRNPLYIFNVLLYVACAALFGLGPYCVLVFGYFAVQYTFIVAYEESILTATFGTPYLDYCRKVPRWFPSMQPEIASSEHTFQLRPALRSERSTLLAMAAIFAVYALKSSLA